MVRSERKAIGGQMGCQEGPLEFQRPGLGWGCRPTCGGQPRGSWGRSQEYSSSRSTLTSMASVCEKLLTRPESSPVRDRA